MGEGGVNTLSKPNLTHRHSMRLGAPNGPGGGGPPPAMAAIRGEGLVPPLFSRRAAPVSVIWKTKEITENIFRVKTVTFDCVPPAGKATVLQLFVLLFWGYRRMIQIARISQYATNMFSLLDINSVLSGIDPHCVGDVMATALRPRGSKVHGHASSSAERTQAPPPNESKAPPPTFPTGREGEGSL